MSRISPAVCSCHRPGRGARIEPHMRLPSPGPRSLGSFARCRCLPPPQPGGEYGGGDARSRGSSWWPSLARVWSMCKYMKPMQLKWAEGTSKSIKRGVGTCRISGRGRDCSLASTRARRARRARVDGESWCGERSRSDHRGGTRADRTPTSTRHGTAQTSRVHEAELRRGRPAPGLVGREGQPHGDRPHRDPSQRPAPTPRSLRPLG